MAEKTTYRIFTEGEGGDLAYLIDTAAYSREDAIKGALADEVIPDELIAELDAGRAVTFVVVPGSALAVVPVQTEVKRTLKVGS